MMLEDPKTQLAKEVVKAVNNVIDPEMPVGVVELGFIYRVHDDGNGGITIEMTLTSPTCGVAQTLPEQVRTEALSVKGVQHVVIEIVWDPPWHFDMMTEEARLALGYF